MSKTFLNLIAVACLLSGACASASVTNAGPATATATNAEVMNAFIQIQAQLHETQLMLESNQQEATDAYERNSEALAAHIQLLEHSIADERASEAASARGMEQAMLMLAGAGMLALAAVVIMVFLQLRAVTRLAEMAVSSPSRGLRTPGVVDAGGALPPPARANLDFSNARLTGVIERLEKRILELEHSTRAPLNETNPDGEHDGHAPADHRVADLLAEGQLLLDTNKPEKAMECFEAALDIQPKHGEALIKKGAALETLGRADEAIACYDRAIEADNSATMALLQKGGLLNRLTRYDEALQCYERALRTQDKKPA